MAGGGVTVADQQINQFVDKGDRLEIATVSTIEEAGENKVEMLKDEPKVILGKWGGEVALGIKYQGIDPTTKGNRPLLTNRTEWKDSKGKEELHSYPLPAGEGMEDGGVEIEIILNEKPSTNVFDFTIDGAENLDFFYQPALTQAEIDEGAERPENVVGSYAVYHKTKENHRVGSTNYATGKAFHIFRPKAVDNDGNEVWAELSYADDVLSVIVPEKFLETAIYPVVVDPTLGYTSIGATGLNLRTFGAYRDTATSTESGIITMMSMAMGCSVASSTAPISSYASAIYSGTSIITNGTTDTFQFSDPQCPDIVKTWRDATFPSNPSISSAVYFLSM